MNHQKTHSKHLVVRLAQTFVAKLRQNPEFYNTRYYKKARTRLRNSQIVW